MSYKIKISGYEKYYTEEERGNTELHREKLFYSVQLCEFSVKLCVKI